VPAQEPAKRDGRYKALVGAPFGLIEAFCEGSLPSFVVSMPKIASPISHRVFRS
jgi:hypothetical protein